MHLRISTTRSTSSNHKKKPAHLKRYAHFWQKRFYDFNVWSEKKKNEKMNCMHLNPVKRGLVGHPKEWRWSSHRFYSTGEKGLCAPNPGWEPSEFKKKTKVLKIKAVVAFRTILRTKKLEAIRT